MAALLVKALPGIGRFCARYNEPFIAKVTADRVTLLERAQPRQLQESGSAPAGSFLRRCFTHRTCPGTAGAEHFKQSPAARCCAW